jgi:hypothetical protein
VHAVDIDTLTKKHEKLMLAARSSSRASGDQTSDQINTKLPEDGIGNIEYFLKVVKMEKYGELFQANNIKTLAELKSTMAIYRQKLRRRNLMSWASHFPIRSSSSRSSAIWGSHELLLQISSIINSMLVPAPLVLPVSSCHSFRLELMVSRRSGATSASPLILS